VLRAGQKKRREGETDGPKGQRPVRVAGRPSGTESVRLAHQVVVAIAGAAMINRAKPRACGCSRGSEWGWTSSPPQVNRRANVKRGPDRPRKVVGSWLRFQPYWGKPTVRNDERGWRKRGHDLMAICHDARKSRYIGSH
jgi:hypothetical protein